MGIWPVKPNDGDQAALRVRAEHADGAAVPGRVGLVDEVGQKQVMLVAEHMRQRRANVRPVRVRDFDHRVALLHLVHRTTSVAELVIELGSRAPFASQPLQHLEGDPPCPC
jgi:hypothetical protein